VDVLQVVADNREQPAAAGDRAVNPDTHAAVDRIAQHQRLIAFQPQHYAGAPARAARAQDMRPHDEAGQ
jgi:hypothetical protein